MDRCPCSSGPVCYHGASFCRRCRRARCVAYHERRQRRYAARTPFLDGALATVAVFVLVVLVVL